MDNLSKWKSRPVQASPAVVSTLVGHRDVGMALTCLASLATYSAESVVFQIHEDGTLTEEDIQQMSDRLPVRNFLFRKETDAKIETNLRNYPHCIDYRRRHAYGLKLFDAPLLAEGKNLAFVDTDILFMRPFEDLFTWPDQQTGCLFMRDCVNAYALRPWHLLMRSSVKMPTRLNSGIFLFRRHYYDLDFIEWLLARYEKPFQSRSFWAEQTCWAALASRAKARFWSGDQIRVIQTESCINDDLVAGHFITPSRGLLAGAVHRMQTACKPVRMATEPMQQLFASELMFEQARSFLHRRF